MPKQRVAMDEASIACSRAPGARCDLGGLRLWGESAMVAEYLPKLVASILGTAGQRTVTLC
jgi:hypothetical protein